MISNYSPFRLRYGLAALGGAILLGTAGFHFIEGWSLLDSLFMTVLTITTVGYGEVHPLSPRGQVFAVFFMIAGVGASAYTLSSSVQAIVQSELITALGRRRRYKEIKRLQGHFIICGAGRVGARIIREMQRARIPFIVIERNGQKVERLMEEGVQVLVRDATLEASLREAGVDRARGLAACLPDDADNVYVVLTARDLNSKLHIVARAVEEQAEPKLIRAGANRVVAPTIIGSHRMAQALMKPAVADFMDSVTAENLDLGFEQVEIASGSIYAGKRLRETNILSELDVVVVAIRRREGQMLFNPSGETQICEGDLLISIGRAESLATIDSLARGGRPANA